MTVLTSGYVCRDYPSPLRCVDNEMRMYRCGCDGLHTLRLYICTHVRIYRLIRTHTANTYVYIEIATKMTTVHMCGLGGNKEMKYRPEGTH
jgi:hypothetical protein